MQVGLRNRARALLDRRFFVPEDRADSAYPPGTREALAEILEKVATALRDATTVASGPTSVFTSSAVVETVQELARRRDALAPRLIHGCQADSAEWTQFGSLLDAVDRLRVGSASARERIAATRLCWPRR